MTQYHMGITGVLSNVTMQFQNVEALRPVFMAQRGADRYMKGWYQLSPTSQGIILSARVPDGLNVLSSPPQSLHRFLSVRNATVLQAGCALTCAGENLYLPMSLCQVLFQGHIMAITNLDTPTGMFHFLAPQALSRP